MSSTGPYNSIQIVVALWYRAYFHSKRVLDYKQGLGSFVMHVVHSGLFLPWPKTMHIKLIKDSKVLPGVSISPVLLTAHASKEPDSQILCQGQCV